jgi:hypothetical protein
MTAARCRARFENEQDSKMSSVPISDSIEIKLQSKFGQPDESTYSTIDLKITVS